MDIAIVDFIGEYGKDTIKNPLGGSETWTMYIASQFAKMGHKTYVINANDRLYIDSNNVTYIGYYRYARTIDRAHLPNFTIISRVIYREVMDFFISLGSKIFLMCHDLYPAFVEGLGWSSEPIFSEVVPSEVDRVFALSEAHKKTLIDKMHVNPYKIRLTINAIDFSKFKNCNSGERDFSILFSSCKSRGLDILVNDVAPLVLREIPEFKVKHCTYEKGVDFSSVASKQWFEQIGGFNKEELYNEMSKHRVWAYPSTFYETFCITAIENVMAGNEVVSPMTYGLSTTLGFMIEDKMLSSFSNRFTYARACNEMASKIVHLMRHYYDSDRIDIREARKEIVMQKYTWENAANTFIDEAMAMDNVKSC